MALTKEQVFDAAEEITKEGGKPILKTVLEKIGYGSYSTIAPYLKEWKQLKKAGGAQAVTNPDPIPDDVHGSLKKLGADFWAVATKRAEEKFDSEREAFEAYKDENEKALEDALQLADTLQEDNHKLIQQGLEQHKALDDLRDVLANSEKQAAIYQARYEEQSKMVEKLQQELEQLKFEKSQKPLDLSVPAPDKAQKVTALEQIEQQAKSRQFGDAVKAEKRGRVYYLTEVSVTPEGAQIADDGAIKLGTSLASSLETLTALKP